MTEIQNIFLGKRCSLLVSLTFMFLIKTKRLSNSLIQGVPRKYEQVWKAVAWSEMNCQSYELVNRENLDLKCDTSFVKIGQNLTKLLALEDMIP